VHRSKFTQYFGKKGSIEDALSLNSDQQIDRMFMYSEVRDMGQDISKKSCVR